MDLMKIQSKKNRINPQSLTLSAFPMIALVTALTGCGGAASNNLADPTAGSDKIVTCAASGSTTCVTGQFVVDAPVVGLNYQCGLVKDITDSTGTVVCPDQSVATFTLQSKDLTRSITLGTYLVKSKRDAGRNATSSLVSITPLDLVPTAANASSLADATAAQAVHIAQLLETLRSATSLYTEGSPTSRLIIDDATKVKINVLAANITIADMASDGFVSKIQPLLTSLNVTLLPQDEAIKRYMTALQTIQAGSYYATPLFIAGIPDISAATAANLATIAKSDTVDDQALLGLSNLIDRSGNLIGQGAEWNGNISPLAGSSGAGTKTAYNLLTGPKGYTRLVPTSAVSFINPVSGFVKDNYIWQPKAVTLDSSYFWTETGAPPTKLGQAIFKNGRLLGGTFIIGTQPLWQNVTNNPTTTLGPDSELAVWNQTNSETSTPYDGKLVLQKTRSVDTFLDPKVYKTSANAGAGNEVFPLFAVLTFSYIDTNKVTQQLGQQGIAILANGNIESDMHQNCHKDATTEYPIGLVGAAFQGVTQISDRFISPIIMLSGSQFQKLDGVQIGSLGFARSAKINVVGAPQGNLIMTDNTSLSTVDSQGNVTLVRTGEQNTDPATYTNFYDLWSNLKNSNPSNKTPADKAVAARSTGKVTITKTTCS